MFAFHVILLAASISYIYNLVSSGTKDKSPEDEKEETTVDTSKPYWELGVLPGRPVDTYDKNMTSSGLKEYRKKGCQVEVIEGGPDEGVILIDFAQPDRDPYNSSDEDYVCHAAKLDAAFKYTELVGGK